MINVIIPFKISPESLAEAKAVIERFVRQVHLNEKNTILYKSFQHKEDETSFTHVMTFRDEGAHALHRTSPYLKEFVEGLYPLCSEKPANIYADEIK